MPKGTTVTVTEQGIKSGKYQVNSSLINIVIPGSVKVINEMTFIGCKNLRTVTISQGVEVIENDAFGDCDNLTEIHIPQSVRRISCNAFRHCRELKIIRVDMKNPWYSDRSGVLYDGKEQVLYFCPEGYTGALTVPQGVQAIHMDAFDGCRQLTSVTFLSNPTYWAYRDHAHYFDSNNLHHTPRRHDGSCCHIDRTGSHGTYYVDISYHTFSLLSPNPKKPVSDWNWENPKMPRIFVGCDALEAIKSPNLKEKTALGDYYPPYMKTVDDALYFGNLLVRYPPARKGSLKFPEYARYIHDGALDGCQYLKEIMIPKTKETQIPEDTRPANSGLALKCLEQCKTISDITLDIACKTDRFVMLAKEKHVNVHYKLYPFTGFKREKWLHDALKGLGKIIAYLIVAAVVVLIVYFFAGGVIAAWVAVLAVVILFIIGLGGSMSIDSIVESGGIVVIYLIALLVVSGLAMNFFGPGVGVGVLILGSIVGYILGDFL
ncbi:MAG: leucine-rich repeat domain-containing protein [Acutalibacteraceae bacterium]|nr:leucine-rich repeat domain-containing protein [Acutalibacteraceae bacterium]